MLKNYFMIAWRNLWKEKRYSMINITGLSVGIAVFVLLSLYVTDEWSFDRFHTKSDRIYRAWVKEHFKGDVFFNTVTPIPLGVELKNNFPEVEQAARYITAGTMVKKEAFSEMETVHMADPAFFKIFDFPLVRGRVENLFNDLRTVVLTEEMGQKYFGDPYPMGQTISLQMDGEWQEFTVKGIIADAPDNSSIQYDFIIPFDNTKTLFREGAFTCWTKNAVWVGLGILGLAAVLFFRFCKGDCPKPEGLAFKSYITENETLLVYEWEPAENASSYRFTFTLGDQELVNQNITGNIATVVLRGDMRGFGRDYIATVAANCRFNRHSAADTSICRAPKKIGIGDISLKGDTIKLVYPGGEDNYGIQFRVKRGGKTIYSLVDGCGYKKVRSKSVIVIPDIPLAVGDTLIYRLALDCNGAFSDESKGIDIFDNGVVTSEIDIFDDTDDFPEECLPCEGCPYIKFRIGATIPSKGGTATVDSSYVWKVYNKQAFCDCLFEPHSSAYCLQNLVGQIYTGNDLPECICNDDDDF